MNYRTLVLTLALLIGFSTAIKAEGQVPIDQVPMYGGMNRSTIPELKASDEKLIAEATHQYGTREKAASVIVVNGFVYYQKYDFANAMRRFNQAWLLDPMNAEVYAGFGSVLHDQEKYCEAMQMMEKSLSLNPPIFKGIYPDAARMVTLCAVNDKTLSPEAKAKLLEHSEALYINAEKTEPNKTYVYDSWATAYYWRGQYAKAWSMVVKERATGGKPSEKFLSLLSEKMPEPTQQ